MGSQVYSVLGQTEGEKEGFFGVDKHGFVL